MLSFRLAKFCMCEKSNRFENQKLENCFNTRQTVHLKTVNIKVYIFCVVKLVIMYYKIVLLYWSMLDLSLNENGRKWKMCLLFYKMDFYPNPFYIMLPKNDVVLLCLQLGKQMLFIIFHHLYQDTIKKNIVYWWVENKLNNVYLSHFHHT